VTSAELEVEDLDEVLEMFHRNGWTDGLPIVPPTPDRVARMLAGAGLAAADEIGFYELRQRPVTAEKIAVNAVMAGCLPEHMPVIAAIVKCMLAPGFGLHVVNSTTGGIPVGFIISGPVRKQLHMNWRGNVLGPGNRANSSIGRAVRLIQINVMGSVSGAGNEGQYSHDRPILDRATVGTAAKYACFHIVENGDDFPELGNYNVEQGYGPDDNVVTVFNANMQLTLDNQAEGTFDGWVEALASYLVGAGRLAHAGFGVLIVPPEAAKKMVEQGWSKADLRTALFERTRRSFAWVKENGWKVGGRYHRGEPAEPGDENVMLGIASSPGDIHVVVAGGPAGDYPTYIFSYGPKWNVATTRIEAGPAVDLTGAVTAALGPLRDLLKVDGYGLDVVSCDDGQAVLQIEAGPDACADCLVPKAMMGQYVDAALKTDPALGGITHELRYPADYVREG
jgi:hypothetical protein